MDTQDKFMLATGALLLTLAPLQSAVAQWGAPGRAPFPPSVTGYVEGREVYLPPGPSGAAIRRDFRRAEIGAWNVPPPGYSPLGPSPTEIRRYQRQMFYRGMGMPY